MEIHYARFIEEHDRIINNTEVSENEFAVNIGDMYRNIRNIFRRRIVRLEQKRLIANQQQQQSERNLQNAIQRNENEIQRNQNVRLWVENQPDSNVGHSDRHSSINIQSNEGMVQPNHRVRSLVEEKNVNSSDGGKIRSRSRSPISLTRSEVHVIGENDLRHKLVNTQNIRRLAVVNIRIMCYNCGNNHPIRKCPRFINMNISRVMDQLNHLNLCNNCLGILDGVDHKCPHKHCGRCGIRVFHNSIICPRNPENSHKL